VKSTPRRDTLGADTMVRQLNAQRDGDGLSELLHAVDVRSAVYCVSELTAPWGFRVEASIVPKFHLVLEGACVLTLDNRESLPLECGDLVLLPAGSGHVMRDRPGSAVRHLDRILAEYRPDADAPLFYGGDGHDGPRTRLLCGGFVLSESLPRQLLALLPGVLRLDAASSGLNRWMEPVFELLSAETAGQRPGSGAILAKLADVFLTQVLRTYLAGAEAAGLLRAEAFNDPAIGQAVELLHSQPERSWTVALLANGVGMSRTHFSQRFRRMVGESPMRYLARVRLSRAAGYLTTTNLTLYAIAQSIGYDSEASLGKAFKREFGQSPGEYRRDRASSPIRLADVNVPEGGASPRSSLLPSKEDASTRRAFGQTPKTFA
jgi:AraC-like DNA-binding protein/mannose-6-phosphate isomerase-like protein (cupin superfamily)